MVIHPFRNAVGLAKPFIFGIGIVFAVQAWGQDVASRSTDDFKARVDEALELLRADDVSRARTVLLPLLAEEPLRGKVSSYQSVLRRVNHSKWGSQTHRREVEQASFPSLTTSEARALFLIWKLTRSERNPEGCQLDSPESLMYYSALNDYAPSQNEIGLLLTHGAQCWAHSPEEGVYWYAKAAQQEYTDARVNLAIARLLGRGTTKNEAEAVDTLTQVAEKGDPRAQFLLGTLRVTGHSMRKNQRQAIKLFRASAKQGFVPAQTSLGELLWERAIVEEEWDEAREWLKRAAKAGDAEAQYALGMAYISGSSGSASEFWRPDEADKWLEEAARQGHLQAQSRLGISYYSQGNFDRAVELLDQAAQRGEPWAQTYLGYAYMQGKGVLQNEATAVDWWRKAAGRSASRAEEALGRAYENGLGVPKDMVQAREWYRRAASHGSMGASDRLQAPEFERLDDKEAGLAFLAELLVAMSATADSSSEIQNSDSYCAGAFSCDPGTNGYLLWEATRP